MDVQTLPGDGLCFNWSVSYIPWYAISQHVSGFTVLLSRDPHHVVSEFITDSSTSLRLCDRIFNYSPVPSIRFFVVEVTKQLIPQRTDICCFTAIVYFVEIFHPLKVPFECDVLRKCFYHKIDCERGYQSPSKSLKIVALGPEEGLLFTILGTNFISCCK